MDRDTSLQPTDDEQEYGLFSMNRRVHRGSKIECERVMRSYIRGLGTAALNSYTVRPLTEKEKSDLRPFKTS